MKKIKTIYFLLIILITITLCGCSNKYKAAIEQVFSFENETCKLSENKDNGCLINEFVSKNLSYDIKNQNSKEAIVEINTIDLEKLIDSAIENTEYNDDYIEYLENIQEYMLTNLESGTFETKTEEVVLFFEKNGNDVTITNIDDIATIVFGAVNEEN